MNAIQLLTSQPWVERLGWTLLHFLWQGVLIATVYAATRKWIARSASANIRYLLACTVLACMAVAPLVTWSLLRPPAAVPVPASAHYVPAAATPAGATRPAPLSGATSRALPQPLLPWVVVTWLTGVLAFWLRLLGGWLRAVRLRSRLVRPAPCEWQQTVHRLKTRIRVSRPARLLVSSLVQAPAVVGWLRPVVLLPVGALTGLPAEQIEALLLHELAHIRRHDYLINVLQSVVEALLFYHRQCGGVGPHPHGAGAVLRRRAYRSPATCSLTSVPWRGGIGAPSHFRAPWPRTAARSRTASPGCWAIRVANRATSPGPGSSPARCCWPSRVCRIRPARARLKFEVAPSSLPPIRVSRRCARSQAG